VYLKEQIWNGSSVINLYYHFLNIMVKVCCSMRVVRKDDGEDTHNFYVCLVCPVYMYTLL